ncbi:MAG: ATP-binding cassette domain-containing protein [Bdellovibrionales bacterium]|nr:ATP-binding cassette domain-containing protein [Bdellovibrionales bacterium]
MGILLQVQSGHKQFGARVLFEKASMAVESGEHIGVIGPNGAGKSTLFKILVGKESLDAGEVTRSNSLRIGYLEQEEVLREAELAAEYITRTSGKPIWELYQLAFGLGLSEAHLQTPIKELSGGFRMRCQLLAQLAKEPQLLLLDEPTNYLDLESLLVLEEFLQSFSGAFLLISHDREFLRRVTDHTLEIEAGSFTKFNGHIDDYFEQKAMLEEQLRAQAVAVENRRKEILDFVRRFGAKATKAKQAQSRLKTLNKLESVEVSPLPMQAKIRIPPPDRTGKLVVQFSGVNLGYDDKTVLEGVDFQMWRGTHLAVVGHNGAGKSTFLKGVAGSLNPQHGDVSWGPNVRIGYYSQHVAESLDLNNTVYESLAEVAHKEITMQDIRDLAGQLLFSDDRIDQKLLKMSGGEKARVALGRVLVQKNPLLVLDEPTNHLDFHTVEALTQALNSYEGSMMVVSHDRSFVSRVAGQVLAIDKGKAEFYPGTYQEYLWSLQKGALAERSEAQNASNQQAKAPSAPTKESAEESGLSKEEKRKLRAQLREQQKRIGYLDRKIEKLQNEFQDDSQKLGEVSGEEAQKLMMDLAYKQKQLDELEEDWLECQEQIESIENDLRG